MIYLDNSATSFPKPFSVNYSVYECMSKSCANPGRSSHSMASDCLKKVLETRELLSSFFNTKNPFSYIFTSNATHALNIALKGTIKKNNRVVTTVFEHNSVLRPLKELEKQLNINIEIIGLDKNRNLDMHAYEKALVSGCDVVVCNIASNVTGSVLPYKEMLSLAHKYHSIFIADASQAAGSIHLDFTNTPFDLVAFPGHKALMGPMGTGVLYISEGIQVNSFMQGGTGSNSMQLQQPEMFPDKLESGTLNVPGIIGLGEGIKYIQKVGLSKIISKKKGLLKKIHESLKHNKSVICYSSPVNNTGIYSFNIKNMDSTWTAGQLNDIYNIAVRPSFHCAPLVHKTYQTNTVGMVRMSLGWFNTREEIEQAIQAVNRISKSF